ncbi:flotillin family protein [Amphritea balenae]|uniref:Flotillin family protein n=1 Tax=Amphritea balenae TaxID=452629 RepID=A0A3P1SNU1_9GAMM|nr:flotillin domain-containing protein [Amphritea balenae]RRC98826.1 flotillin family protein [Amphritea balenae]GGK62095.1 flotillin [Amphritea balenae]
MFLDLTKIGTIAGVIVIGLITIGLILTRLYRRASKETSFVRTGFGGQKVIMNGGALVLPVLHEVIPVNMNTLRLEVKRANEQALITRDRMRVDVLAEFYVRVQPTSESIANAAQTLGMRTMEPEALKELVEGKFVDALRAVAAEMAMIELHEQRVDFVQKVQQVVSEDLLKNGLELESVSLTGLDQTSKEFFNPDNAFDAEGLTKLTEAIEERRKRRNEIEQETEVSIATKNLDAEKQQLEITRDQEYARLQQSREVEIRKALIDAEITREQAENQRAAEQAQILATQQTEQSRIASDRAVEEERIDMERQIKEKEIAKNKAIETASIDKEKIIENASIEKRRVIELAEQDKSVAIAEKSREQSVAEAEASRARSEAVKAEEQVTTVKQTEIAEREKQIELVEASKEAERQAISIKVAAEAEKEVAEDHADSIRITAQANADQQRINAEAEAIAEKLTAEASEIRYGVDAEGKRALNEAENLLDPDQIARQIRLALIDKLPEIIRESVKPMEQIDGIKIYQVDGLNGGQTAVAGSEQNSSSLADQVVNSALRYKAQGPLVDNLLEEIGLKGNSLNGLTAAVTDVDK